ncbi:integrator complex assembly factor BRAT1 isoform X1 [Poecilia latipinna]|uniref:integrator complex assembly factor BRAT1 isoform X1 n=1 Tax=Poecilia latipinna TaxID=48699 RepID=UPI00072EC97C|nr:PREDICTED: BRCA1-associated ATM activator 1 isoform X1 [Poecilia latipinna]
MDSQCVSILPRVCGVLLVSGSSLPDDTSLEKLLDWFTTIAQTGTSLLEACPCLVDFVSKVAFNYTSGSSILSFTLKLTGLIGASEDGFKVLKECSVLKLVFNPQHWQEAGLWEDPCLRIGWIQGLKMILKHSEALSFFAQADLIEPLLQLQTDSSLFVASAANQTLAQVLLLCQSPSSVGHNGSKNRDLEHNSASMETTQNYSGIITKVSDYLNKSVVLKEISQLPGSQQILRLLALLLVRVGPPLRDTLLLAVINSLEELVTTSCSQLTVPLLDVILAANSGLRDDCVPKQRLIRLLWVMLNMKKPVDVMQAAAAVLRSHQSDPALSAHSARVLLLPLDIVTGVSLLDENSTGEQTTLVCFYMCNKCLLTPFKSMLSNPAEEELRILITEQLKRKSCISMICVCLSNIPQITLMASDCLPCPQRLIVTAVLLLLRLCCVDSSSSSAGCVEVVRFITGNSKVQKCALEALLVLSKSPGVKMVLVEVFKVLTEYLNSHSSDPSVLQKSYQAVIKWVRVCPDLSCITDQLREGFIQAVRKRACDTRWEARDSTVEFLGHLVGAPSCWAFTEQEMEPSDVLLGGCSFTVPLLKEALQDPESYVRASSISALAQTLTPSWQDGTALTQEQEDIVTQLQEVLFQDSEGFARRAAVKYFIAWFSACSSPSSCWLLMQSVPTVLSQGVADLDWEVKLHTLELAELVLDRAFSDPSPSHPYAVMSDQDHRLPIAGQQSDLLSSLKNLVDWGVVSALLCGVVDCDRPVALKACQLLLKLRGIVCPVMDNTADTRVFCQLAGASVMQQVRKIQEMGKDTCVVSEACSEADKEGICASVDPECVSVCEVLRVLDLDEKLSILTQSSDHIYNSPLSLLQDILTAAAASSPPGQDPRQELVMDCY